ncbi:hypothetical protein [Erysipelothrix anatis]|uniref:hypothetical protein n=1 Tax=Erysipelothrix anatis TaxID=2683713 RepID=UPI001357874E|nr:hypothetical protein [Erysipelothrix anatis]
MKRLTILQIRQKYNVDLYFDICGGTRLYFCKNENGDILFSHLTSLKSVVKFLEKRSDEE